MLLGSPLVCGRAIRLTPVLAFFGFLVGNGTDSVSAAERELETELACTVGSDTKTDRGLGTESSCATGSDCDTATRLEIESGSAGDAYVSIAGWDTEDSISIAAAESRYCSFEGALSSVGV